MNSLGLKMLEDAYAKQEIKIILNIGIKFIGIRDFDLFYLKTPIRERKIVAHEHIVKMRNLHILIGIQPE